MSKPEFLADVSSIDIMLEVGPAQGAYEYQWSSPSGRFEFLPRVTRSPEIHRPDEFRSWIFERLEALHRGVDQDARYLRPDEALPEVESLGRLLAERLFRPCMNESWRRLPADASLLVMTHEPWIPWEIVKPRGMDFLALHFRMGRWLGTVQGEDPLPPRTLQARRALVADAANPKDSQSEALTEAPREVGAIRQALTAAGIDVRHRSDVSRRQFEDDLSTLDVDLIHVVAHGEYEENADEASLVLHDRKLRSHHLMADGIRDNVRRNRPFVAFSACDVGRLGSSLSGIGGWPAAWIQTCGASAFLGPLWRVNSTRTADFFDVLYARLTTGQGPAEALLGARRQLRRENSKDLTWLAWSLHGHPDAEFVPPNPPREPAHDPVGLRSDEGSYDGADERQNHPSETSSIVFTARLDPWLQSVLPLPTRDFDSSLSPAAVLRADHEVVPFHGRQRQMKELQSWFDAEPRISVWYFSGEGGMGKTRLAREFCRSQRRRGLVAGQLPSEAEPAETWRNLEELGGRCLVLVDYAESRRKEIAFLLRKALESNLGPFRFLLLSRGRDGWNALKEEGHGVGRLLRNRQTTTVERLLPLALGAEERFDSYRRALTKFAEVLGRKEPRPVRSDFMRKEFDRVLLLHAKALADIERASLETTDVEAGEPEDTSFGILDYLLDREIQFWRRSAEERNLLDHLDVGIRRAMAVITFRRGVDNEAAAVETMRELVSLEKESDQTLVRIAHMLSDMYPGDRWIEPLYPDLLGEHLVQRELEAGGDELIDIVFGPKVPARRA